MKKLVNITILAVGAMVAACSSCGSGRSDFADEARERAEMAAQNLIAEDHSDTMALQHRILDAKAIQSEYVLKGDTVAARIFDDAFRDYLVQHDDTLARAVFHKS